MLKIIFIITTVIAVLLTAYLIIILIRLNKLKKSNLEKYYERRNNIISSCNIIIDSMVKGNCDYSEGVIRLKHLLDVIGLDIHKYNAINDLFNVVGEMSIREDRKRLDKKERVKQDMKRFKAESVYAEQILKELPLLKEEINNT